MRAEGLGTDWLEAAGTEKGTAEAVPQAGERGEQDKGENNAAGSQQLFLGK